MTTEQALLHARHYVEAVKGCTTIDSFPIKGETPRRHIIGVSTIDRTFQVVMDEELDAALLLEICDRRPLSDLLGKRIKCLIIFVLSC